jgi:hypothetical protein
MDQINKIYKEWRRLNVWALENGLDYKKVVSIEFEKYLKGLKDEAERLERGLHAESSGS